MVEDVLQIHASLPSQGGNFVLRMAYVVCRVDGQVLLQEIRADAMAFLRAQVLEIIGSFKRAARYVYTAITAIFDKQA
jgi:hypothetical protein